MVSTVDELDKFIQKFKSLCVSGSNARLVVQAEAESGIANISLSVDIRLDRHENVKVAEKSRRNGAYGGSPSRQRRRARREAERLAKAAAAAEAGNASDDVVMIDHSQETIDKVQAEMSEQEFDLSFDVQESVKHYDVLEAIEVNYGGSLDDRNVSTDDPCRLISCINVKQEAVENYTDVGMKTVTCRISVKKDENASHVINDWKKSSNFDDLAFRNAVRGSRQVMIREVKEIE